MTQSSGNQTLNVLWKGKALVVIAVVVTTVCAWATTKLASKVYSSTAVIQVNSDVVSSNGDTLGQQQASQGLATTYATLVDSSSFLARIGPKVESGRLSASELSGRVSGDALQSGTQSTNLIDLSATGPTGAQARRLANEVAAAFVATVEGDVKARADKQQAQLQARIDQLTGNIRRIQSSSSATSSNEQLVALRSARSAIINQLANLLVTGVTRGGSVTVVASAQEPTAPISPRPKLSLLVGFLLGTLIGIALAWLRHVLDRFIESSLEVGELVDVPVLGSIPLLRSRREDDPVTPEAYEVLRTNVGFLALEGSIQVITVTSYEMGEGKTSVVEGLGRAAAQAGKRVLLVDGDLRTGALTRRLGHKSRAGLATLITSGVMNSTLSGGPRTNDAHSPDPIVRVTPGLDLLLAGPIPPNPASLLASKRLQDLFESLRAAYDLIIVDSPPLSHLADAAHLASASDGSIVVARSGSTKKAYLPAAIASLQQGPVPVLGVVVFESMSIQPYYYPQVKHPDQKNVVNQKLAQVRQLR